ncbi:multivesicular body subunit 12A [Lutzomyia longipalpis]|uniref:Multivesicular body subunit 12A n=2 Tax=Lutzomyia longipalpis TaxID=7200 RepID=A0A1B0GII9_LUTLO|nr:multivesicular body subunit 12A [Lutzomyia longipalpis]
MSSSNFLKNKNVINTVLNILPDNRPLTGLIVVENHEKCPKNFAPIHLTYDQDSDADLWRESYIFAKHPGRYLCMSKQDTDADTVVETISVIGANERTPEGFSSIKQTTDSAQKAWRKRQLIYKVVERKNASKAVTDIIICSKSKKAPSGFLVAGEISGLSVCYKVGPATRPLPELPPPPPIDNREKALSALGNLSISHIYENTQTSPQAPLRPAPKPPTPTSTLYGTLGGATYAEIEGVPFVLNPNLRRNNDFINVPDFKPSSTLSSSNIDYDFALERQILCTTKAISLTNNPFFH